MLKRHGQLFEALLKLADVGVGAVAWGLAYYARFLGGEYRLTPHPMPTFGEFLPPMVFSLVLTPLMFIGLGLYRPKRATSLARDIMDVSRAVVLVWLSTYVFANMTRQVMISRLVMLCLLVFWVFLAAGNRLVARKVLRWFRQRGWNVRYAAILGTGRLAQKLFLTLRKNPWTGINIRYFIGDANARRQLLGLNIIGPADAVAEILANKPVDMVFVALPRRDYDWTERILNRLTTCAVDVHIVPDLLFARLLSHEVTQLDNLAIISLTRSPQHGWNSLLKRAFDLLVSAVALIVLALPMLVICLAIKLGGKGPIFYKQRRASLDGKEFELVKFRSMREDVEVETGPVWGATNDPRATRVGRFLRRTGLDELPQLFNVLKGDMSLVGPRPERPEHVERFRRQFPKYMLRSHVKAGLTGWAQIHGFRGRTSLRKRIQYDLYYITNWTFGLDLLILLLTPFRLISKGQ